jgi:hypothetical protein
MLEVGQTPLVDHHALAVERGGRDGQGEHGLDHQLISPVLGVTREHADAIAVEPLSALSTSKFLFNSNGIMPVLSAAVAGTATAQLGVQAARGRAVAAGVMSARATTGARAVA